MFKFNYDNSKYIDPKDINDKNPYRFGSKNAKKFDLKITELFMQSNNKKNTKFVLLNSDKETNYNKNSNTIFVNPYEVRRYQKLKEFLK